MIKLIQITTYEFEYIQLLNAYMNIGNHLTIIIEGKNKEDFESSKKAISNNLTILKEKHKYYSLYICVQIVIINTFEISPTFCHIYQENRANRTTNITRQAMFQSMCMI